MPLTGFRKPSHFSIHKHIILPDVFVSYGCYNSFSQTWGLQRTNLILCQNSKISFTGQDEGLSRVMIILESPGTIRSLPPPASGACRHSLACGHITPLSVSFILTSPSPLSCCLISLSLSFIRILGRGTSLVAQWLRIHWLLQRTQVGFPDSHEATKSACHTYWSPDPRAHSPKQEKPPQWEACASVAPDCWN